MFIAKKRVRLCHDNRLTPGSGQLADVDLHARGLARARSGLLYRVRCDDCSRRVWFVTIFLVFNDCMRVSIMLMRLTYDDKGKV